MEWYNEQVGAEILRKKYFHVGEENLKDMVKRITECFSPNIQHRVAEAIYNADFFPGGRSLYALGCKGKFSATTSNCYVLPSPKDNLSSIFDVGKEMAIVFSRGGGCGINLSHLRPNGAKVRNVAKTSTGAVSFMELYNVIGGIISQNGRRGALLLGLECTHPDIDEFLKVKQNNEAIQSANISVLFTNEFLSHAFIKSYDNGSRIFDLTYTVESTGEEIRKSIDAGRFMDDFCSANMDYAEPGAIFLDRVREWNLLSEDKDYLVEISNPCLTADMKLLTVDGYKSIFSLEGTEPTIINKDGKAVKSKVWCSGEKEVVELRTKRGYTLIRCTPDHRFMTANGEEIQAQHIKGHRLMPYVHSLKHCRQYVQYGFIQGDGQLSRLNSTAHNGIEVNIGEKDWEIRELFNVSDKDFVKDGRRVYVKGIKDDLIKLGFSSECLPKREFPTEYHNFSPAEQRSFLRGCYSANGSVIKAGRIAYKTTCEVFANQMADALSHFGIDAYLTKNKAKKVKFSNGEYECRESFDVNICAFEYMYLFAELIGFEQQYKMDALLEVLKKTSPALYVKFNGEVEKVYDFTESETHWGVVEGFVTHNCGEYFGSAYNACNLGSINLYNVIDNKFTPEACVNWGKLAKSVETAVEALDEILDYGRELQPLEENKKNIDDYRAIGLGVFGLADALIGLGIRYGSDDSKKMCRQMMREIFCAALRTSCRLAKEKGAFLKCNPSTIINSPIIKNLLDPLSQLYQDIYMHGLRNASLISIAPTGSIATMSGMSGGIEPLYQIAYRRTTHSLVKEGKYFDVFAKSVKDLLEHHGINPSTVSIEGIQERFPFVVAAHDVNPIDRVELQASMQVFVDNAISSTVNMKAGSTLEEVRNVYETAWKLGCKGVTVFVDGCKRTAIMGEAKPEETAKAPVVPSIEFDSVVPIKRKNLKDAEYTAENHYAKTACVRNFHGFTTKLNGKDLFEIFTFNSGGCQSNIATITRLSSLALRSGVKVEELLEELREQKCPACMELRKQGRTDISQSCGCAIADIIEKSYGEKEVKKAEEEKRIGLLPCPECGELTLRPEGRCNTCSACGYSKCE